MSDRAREGAKCEVPYSEASAEGAVEMLRYMLYEQPTELHVHEVEEERWFLEVGERPAFGLSDYRPGDAVHFAIMVVSPWLYRMDPSAFEPFEVPRFEDDPVAKRLGLVP